MDLIPQHFKHLRASALSDAMIETMACRSLAREEVAALSPFVAQSESILAFPYPECNGYVRYRLFPPQNEIKYFQVPGSTSHLYVLPQVLAVLSNPQIDLAFSEGEKKSACLTAHGIPTVGVAGVWNWIVKDSYELLPEFSQIALVDRNVSIFFDSDTWIKEEIQRALFAFGKALEGRGANVQVTILPPAEGGTKQGCDDYVAQHGIGKFRELKKVKLRHDALCQHRSWWENWRKSKTQQSKELARIAAKLIPVEPWPDAVDGVDLADEILGTFKRFIVTAQPDAIIVETIWILFAHALNAFGIAPILAFWSPEPNCGKSVNQSIVAKLTPKSIEGSSLTEAVVFRVIDQFQPTLHVDEAADILSQRPELMALYRASHMRAKAYVYRTVGDNHDVTAFSTWSPKSLAITKTRIENALASRCLVIRMHRKTKSDRTERFSGTKEYPEIDCLCRKAARWAHGNLDAIREAAPDFPDIENRNLDNYEPLFKIAHVIGGPWPDLISAQRSSWSAVISQPISRSRSNC